MEYISNNLEHSRDFTLSLRLLLVPGGEVKKYQNRHVRQVHITCASCRLVWLFTSQPRTKSGRSDKVKSLKCSKLSEMYSLGSDWSLNTSRHDFISPFFHRTSYKGMKSAYFPIKRLGNSKYTILSPFWAWEVLNHSTSSARRKFSGHHIIMW